MNNNLTYKGENEAIHVELADRLLDINNRLIHLQTTLDTTLNQINNGVLELNPKYYYNREIIDSKLENLSNTLNYKIDELDKQFQNIKKENETRLNMANELVDECSGLFDDEEFMSKLNYILSEENNQKIDAKYNEIKKLFSDIEIKINNVTNEQDAIRKRIATLEDAVKEVEKKIAALNK